MDSKLNSSSISYVLFMYREQLRQGETQSIRMNRTKLSLTDKLIKKTVGNIKNCSTEDVLATSRQIVFQTKLKNQIQRMNQLRKSQQSRSSRTIERK